MILVDEVRISSSGHRFELNKFEASSASALRRFFALELDYGGRITKLTDTEVTVQTPVFGQTDISTYSGDAEEMELIVRGAVIHTAVVQGVDPTELTDTLNILLGDHAGNPLFVTTFAPFILGSYSKASFSLLMGLDLADERVKSASFKDLIDIDEMAEADGIDFIEAFDLLVAA